MAQAGHIFATNKTIKSMENKDKTLRSGEDSMVCEFAFWLGKRTDIDKLRESYLETSEEVGCFSF